MKYANDDIWFFNADMFADPIKNPSLNNNHNFHFYT